MNIVSEWANLCQFAALSSQSVAVVGRGSGDESEHS
jgi:hypothetical protein